MAKLSSEDRLSYLQMEIGHGLETWGKRVSYLTLKTERRWSAWDEGVWLTYCGVEKAPIYQSDGVRGNMQQLIGASMFIVLLISRDVVRPVKIRSLWIQGGCRNKSTKNYSSTQASLLKQWWRISLVIAFNNSPASGWKFPLHGRWVMARSEPHFTKP